MGNRCEQCGEEFDSERGLHIHQSQKHDEESENHTTTNTFRSDSQSPGITFTTKQFGYATFAAGILLGLVLGGLGGATAAGMIQSSGETAGPNPAKNTEDSGDTGSQTETIDMSKIEMKGEPVKGREDAPVTMVMYEDYQCPFCKRFETGALPKIVENYVKTGKVKLVWKDRPLPQLHPWAEPAAAAMECVYRKGGNDAFWPVKNKVFANQNQISTNNVQSKIKSWAAEEGVSKSSIQSCLENGNPMKEVNEDSKEGQSIGAGGTPTSFINGKKLVGAQPFSRFKTVIENELNN